MTTENLYNSKQSFELNGKRYHYYRLKAIEEAGVAKISRLPYSIRVLLESVLRQVDGRVITKDHVDNLAKWGTGEVKDGEVPFKPSREIGRAHV